MTVLPHTGRDVPEAAEAAAAADVASLPAAAAAAADDDDCKLKSCRSCCTATSAVDNFPLNLLAQTCHFIAQEEVIHTVLQVPGVEWPDKRQKHEQDTGHCSCFHSARKMSTCACSKGCKDVCM